MSGVRSLCAPTGGTTLRAQTGWCGWWTAQTGSGWRIAGRSSACCCRKRWNSDYGSLFDQQKKRKSDNIWQKCVGSGHLWLILPPPPPQRLAGATLLVFANKQDLPGALSKAAIQEVRTAEHFPCSYRSCYFTTSGVPAGTGPRWDQEPPLVHHRLQRSDRWELANRSGLATGGHCCSDLYCRVMDKFLLNWTNKPKPVFDLKNSS